MRPPRVAEALLRGFIADPDLEEALPGDLATALRTLLPTTDRRRRKAGAGRRTPTLEDEMTKKSPVRIARRLFARPALAAAVILTVPLVATQFTDEVVWTLSDFVVMGTLVVGTGVLFELTLKKTEVTAYRIAAGIALGAAFLLVWVNGAVGLIGSEANPANLMYAGVLAVGVTGAFVARLRPRGMARAMAAAAVAQALVALIAILYGLGRPYSGAVEIALLNGFFVALFAGSAWLFRRAARDLPATVARSAG